MIPAVATAQDVSFLYTLPTMPEYDLTLQTGTHSNKYNPLLAVPTSHDLPSPSEHQSSLHDNLPPSKSSHILPRSSPSF